MVSIDDKLNLKVEQEEFLNSISQAAPYFLKYLPGYPSFLSIPYAIHFKWAVFYSTLNPAN